MMLAPSFEVYIFFQTYAIITLAIVVLIPRAAPAWITALHRFLEVSVGIVVALAIVALWPDINRPWRTAQKNSN
jgi:uncharacterized membrane protein YgaE (UPF0421/DUF939 family)